MYQMYAYHTRYQNIKKVILLYPLYENLDGVEYKTTVFDTNGKEVLIQIKMFNLYKYIKEKQPFLECIEPPVEGL